MKLNEAIQRLYTFNRFTAPRMAFPKLNGFDVNGWSYIYAEDEVYLVIRDVDSAMWTVQARSPIEALQKVVKKVCDGHSICNQNGENNLCVTNCGTLSIKM